MIGCWCVIPTLSLGVIPTLSLALFAAMPASWPSRAAGPAAGQARLTRDSTAISAMLDRGAVDSAFAAAHVMVAADSPLQRVPFAALIPSGAGDTRMVSRAIVSMVPSASLLAELRSRRPTTGRRLFAMAGSPGPGRAPLSGAKREVEALATNFRDVDEWFGDARSPAPLTPGRLRAYRALHFAGHAHVDDQLPWRSGLASAFLAAGSSAVVASLWPVEDRATERLMRRFYDGLARDLTADRALAEAQLALTRDPSTAAPFYWAGFVLVGDGRATLPLARRPFPIPRTGAWAIVFASLAVIAAWVGWPRRRSR
jgi:hypothetical protein